MSTADRRHSMIIVAGPTASGKSALASRVAGVYGGTVVNADSMQVYRELRILTARPSAEEEAEVPHRLYGVISAAETCSAGRWRNMAIAEIEAALRAGSVPVLVGGTGFYIKALLEGLSPIPEIAGEIRRAVRERLQRLGREALLVELARFDPTSAAMIPAADTQRLLRALEVYEGTGRPLSWWQGQPPVGAAPPIRTLTLVLAPPRADLYSACDARFDRMMEEGAIEEVGRLAAMRLPPDVPALRAVGVRELLRHLHGEIALDEAVHLARTATRRYAKRQTTWFRHQVPGAVQLASQFSESLTREIFPIIDEFMLTP